LEARHCSDAGDQVKPKPATGNYQRATALQRTGHLCGLAYGRWPWLRV